MKVCLEPDCWNVTDGTRCREHEAAYQRARNADPRRKPRRTAAYMRTVIEGGCACCGTTADLTRHHPDPLARRDPRDLSTIGALVPMCRRCNSSIGTHRMETWTCPMHGGRIAD